MLLAGERVDQVLDAALDLADVLHAGVDLGAAGLEGHPAVRREPPRGGEQATAPPAAALAHHQQRLVAPDRGGERVDLVHQRHVLVDVAGRAHDLLRAPRAADLAQRERDVALANRQPQRGDHARGQRVPERQGERHRPADLRVREPVDRVGLVAPPPCHRLELLERGALPGRARDLERVEHQPRDHVLVERAQQEDAARPTCGVERVHDLARDAGALRRARAAPRAPRTPRSACGPFAYSNRTSWSNVPASATACRNVGFASSIEARRSGFGSARSVSKARSRSRQRSPASSS